MKWNHYLLMGWALLASLTACQTSNDGSDSAAEQSEASADVNYVKVNFRGKTKVYTGIELSRIAELDSIKLWEINAGDTGDDYLSLGIYGDTTGTYPFGNPLSRQSRISIAKYQLDTLAYGSSKAAVCPSYSGLHIANGFVKVDQYQKNKLAKGTFSGRLMAKDGADCDTTGLAFSGEFYLTASGQ